MRISQIFVVVLIYYIISFHWVSLGAGGIGVTHSSEKIEPRDAYTGLIIDVSGLGLVAHKRLMSLYDENDKIVAEPFDREYFITASDVSIIRDKRIGDNPLRINAKGVRGGHGNDLIIYNRDAKMILDGVVGEQIFKNAKIIVLITEENLTKTYKPKSNHIGTFRTTMERTAICKEHEDTAVGSGTIIFGDRVQARNEAMRDAYGNVMAKFLNISQPSEHITEYNDIFKDIITGNTHGFVKDWDIVSENDIDSIYCVEVQPVVESREISVDDIKAIRLMIKLMNDPRIFVSIKEFVNGKASNELIATHTLKTILGGSGDHLLYNIVGSVENADIVISGDSRLSSFKPNLADFSETSFLSCNSEIKVDIKVGDMEKCALTNTKKKICIPQKRNDLTKACAEKLGRKLISKLLLCMESSIRLVIHNIDANSYTLFSEHLSQIHDVNSVYFRGYQDMTGVYDVRVSNTANELVTSLQKFAPHLKIITASNSQIEINM